MAGLALERKRRARARGDARIHPVCSSDSVTYRVTAIEVVFGVRAIIAGCNAAVGSVTTVLPTTTFFSSVLWTTGPCYCARYLRSAGEGLFTLITVIPRQRECHIQR